MLEFPFNLYGLALGAAWLASLVAVPLWRGWSYRTGFVDDPGHRKIHDRPVALAGGLAVLTGVLLPLLLGALLIAGLHWGFADSAAWARAGQWLVDSSSVGLVGYGLSRRVIELSAILVGAVAITILGWVDDKFELRPALKFAGQAAIAGAVAAAGVRITLFVPNVLFSYAITVLWVLTIVNAFNFMDNMNGLCAGLGAIGAWYFAVSAAGQGQYLVALLAFLGCGALLGFLPYNFPKASIFLGDAGSHLVGYLLAVLAILPHFYSEQNPKPWAVLSPLLILAVPLADLAWVVVLRWRAGKPFYIGDTNHLSHRLVRNGLSRSQAVLVIWLLAAAAGAMSFL